MISVIADTREKKCFNLEFYGFNVIHRALKSGDYSVLGMEDFISIDRKASIEELVSNLFYDYKRFKKELIRASIIPQFYLVLEFNQSWVDIFPNGTNIPKKRHPYLRANTKLIYHKLDLIYKNYGVKTIFCENREEAEQKTVELLNLAINNESFDHIEYFRSPNE
jgi:ERCC4-type nuclease